LPRLSESILRLARRSDSRLTIAGGLVMFCAEFGELFLDDGDPQGFELLEKAGSLMTAEIPLEECFVSRVKMFLCLFLVSQTQLREECFNFRCGFFGGGNLLVGDFDLFFDCGGFFPKFR
jgi:hypothetical protein